MASSPKLAASRIMPVARRFTRATGDRLRLAFFCELLLPSRFRPTPLTVRFAALFLRLEVPRTLFFREPLRVVDFRPPFRVVRFMFRIPTLHVRVLSCEYVTLSA
jgi:hypothetical protein